MSLYRSLSTIIYVTVKFYRTDPGFGPMIAAPDLVVVEGGEADADDHFRLSPSGQSLSLSHKNTRADSIVID